MSFEQQLATATATARTFKQIDVLSRTLWRAHGEGLISDSAAQAAAEALQARKSLFRDTHTGGPQKRVGGLPRRAAPRSPDREKSMRRRRACAMSGAVPAAIASAFTVGELAVLSVVAGQARKTGDCRLPIDAVAALAGVCRRTAQGALRRAAAMGLVHIHERPRQGAKHLSNVVTVTDSAWRAWLRLGGPDRVQKPAHHVNNSVPICGRHGQDSLARSGSVLSYRQQQPEPELLCRNRSQRSPSQKPQRS